MCALPQVHATVASPYTQINMILEACSFCPQAPTTSMVPADLGASPWCMRLLCLLLKNIARKKETCSLYNLYQNCPERMPRRTLILLVLTKLLMPNCGHHLYNLLYHCNLKPKLKRHLTATHMRKP